MKLQYEESGPASTSTSPAEAAAAGGAVQLKAKHSLAIRWFHWINFPVLMLMIWSGLLIYWANDVYRVGWGSATLFHFFPEAFYRRALVVLPNPDGSFSGRLAEGMAWHFTLMWAFALNGVAYVLYLALSGEWRQLLPGRSTLRDAVQVVLHDLRIRRAPLPRAKFNGAQRIAYSGVILMGLGSLLTGLAIHKPIQLAVLSSPLGGLASTLGFNATGYEVARWAHFWLTIGFCGFFLIHVLQVARAGWNNFRAMITGFEIAPPDDAPSDGVPTRSDSPAPAAHADAAPML